MSSSGSTTKIPTELRVLIVAAFIIAIGFGIIAPVLPQYAESFGVGAFEVSAVVSAFGLARLLFAPVSGRATSKFGEPWVYITGVTVVGLSMFLIAFAQTYWQLLLFRGLGGIGSTLFTVSAMAYLARKSPPHIRGRISGAYASAFLVGNISGPLIGGLLVGLGHRAPFFIYGTSLLIAAGLVFIKLRDDGASAVAGTDEREPFPLREALQNTSYRAALGSFFANGWATFGVRNSITPLFAASAFTTTGFFLDGPQTAAAALSVFAAGNIVAINFSSRLSDVHGRKPLIITGLLIASVATGVIGIMPNPWLFLLISLIAGAGTGLLNAPQQAAIADIVGQHRSSGTVMSSAQMSADVGAIIGPLLVGVIVDHIGYGWGFAITGAIMALASLGWMFAPETNLPVEPGGPRTGALPTVRDEKSKHPHEQGRDI